MNIVSFVFYFGVVIYWKSILRKALQFVFTVYIYIVTLHIKNVSLKLFLNSEFGKIISRDQLLMTSSWESCFSHFQSKSNCRP